MSTAVPLLSHPHSFDRIYPTRFFAVFDKNGDGTVPVNEIKVQCGELIATGQLTDTEFKDMTNPFVEKGQLNYEDLAPELVA